MMQLAHLPDSEPGEEVVLFLRRHWIDLVRIFLFTSLLIVVPIVSLTALTLGGVEVFENPLAGALATVILSTYAVIVLVLTITELTDYWLDSWIVTTERVIDIEQLGLFNRVVSEVHLSQIQDITSETRGFLATFLTYGNVFVQTAAEKERFQFKNIDNPDQVKFKISELTEVCKTHHHHTKTGAKPDFTKEM
jgi:membrane protein YdbS with pleckstrin-like domain